MVRPHRFEVWTRFAWGLYIWKTSMPELCHLKCSCHCKLPMGRVFRVCSRFVHMKTQHVRVLAASVLFLSLFWAGWCLLMLPEALAPTSMFEREWQIHVSHRQFACHSATTARVVWLLALDFIFTPCVSPCPGILILDVVQTRSLLDGSHTGAFDFSRLCLYQHGLGGRGGAPWI